MDLHHIKNNWNSKQVDTKIYIYIYLFIYLQRLLNTSV